MALKVEVLAGLAKDVWELSLQIQALEAWLFSNHVNLVAGKYIADIGFSIRESACSGGAILTPEAMAIMSQLGIKLYFSEYAD